MIRIAVTGPESSGKTTLCEALAKHFNVTFIPEFSRTYLEATNGKYSQVDLDKIAQGQLDSLNASNDSIKICDTDFSVIEIWSDYKYVEVSSFIKELAAKDLFDLHILCTPDIPWEDDPLRENPDDRDVLFELYVASLNKHNKQYITVSGDHEQRLEKSLEKINSL